MLDSLRGLAALSVLFTHVLQRVVTPGELNHTPMRMLVDGRCFVIFFFVLSGFVLATAYWNQAGRLSYLPYVARRLVRLYPPYAAAGILAAVAIWLSGRDLSCVQLRDYFLTLGTTQGTAIDRPSWSLTYELHLSLIIPLLCLLIVRGARMFAWATCLVFAVVEIAILKLGISQFPYAVDDILTSAIVTLRFAVCFALGVILARLHLQRPNAFATVARYPFVTAFVASLLMSILLDQTSMIGAAIIIVLALHWPAMQAFMAFKPFTWLGRISYSLYLTHFVVIEFTVALLRGSAPPLVDAVVAFLAAFVVADIFHRLVEAPSIALSRRIGGRTRAESLAPLAR